MEFFFKINKRDSTFIREMRVSPTQPKDDPWVWRQLNSSIGQIIATHYIIFHIFKVQHSPRESEATPTGGDTSAASKQRSSAGLLPRNKRTDHLGIFRSASPVTTHSASSTNENSLFLALPAASKGRGRSLSAASLCNENGTSSFLSDEKLLIK